MAETTELSQADDRAVRREARKGGGFRTVMLRVYEQDEAAIRSTGYRNEYVLRRPDAPDGA